MTVVNISGTFAKDQRPNNGLDAIADKLKGDHFLRLPVVGIIEFHAYHDVVGRPESITVKFAALEPLFGDADDQARQMLDQARKQRGLGQVELTLFDADAPGESPDRDPGAGPWPGDADYTSTDTSEAATDDGPSSDRVRDEWLDDSAGGATPSAPEPKTRRRRPPPPPADATDGQ